MTIEDVASYIYRRRATTKLARWTEPQIASYVQESIEAATIRTVQDSDGSLCGVVMFAPDRRGKFWVEQIWADNKNALALMLRRLQLEYPAVKEIWGLRKNNRPVKFSLNILLKYYERS